MNKRNPISVKLTKAGKVIIDFGVFYWPWPVLEICYHGDIIEIVDARGVSTVHLGDITIADLDHQ